MCSRTALQHAMRDVYAWQRACIQAPSMQRRVHRGYVPEWGLQRAVAASAAALAANCRCGQALCTTAVLTGVCVRQWQGVVSLVAAYAVRTAVPAFRMPGNTCVIDPQTMPSQLLH